MRLFAATYGKVLSNRMYPIPEIFCNEKGRARLPCRPRSVDRTRPPQTSMEKLARLTNEQSRSLGNSSTLRDVSASRSRARAAGFPVPCGRPLTAIRLSFYGHKCSSRRRDHCRGRIMRAQRVRNPVGVDKRNAEIERLQLELASFNKRIDELEQLHPLSPTIEALKSKALALSRQIDEVRSSKATEELTGLLSK